MPISYQSITDKEYQNMLDCAITYGIHSTRFGNCVIGLIDEQICYLGFADDIKELKDEWYLSSIKRDNAKTEGLVKRIFTYSTNEFNLLLKGTDFQVDVWKALINIKDKVSYEEVACKVGRPKAVRAVASAIASNHISYLIPCHLVVRKSGHLGGYRWGLERKKALLMAEKSL